MRFLIRIYFFVWGWFVRLRQAAKAAQACFVGLWLGVLTREQMQAIDEEYYTRTKREMPNEFNFHSKEYNRRGLFDWEKKVLPDHFGDCRSLLVYGAGGGRDTLALQHLGYRVDALESHPDLVAVANELLREEGLEPTVRLGPRDECQNTGKRYDGIILSFGTYMLVQGRKRRIGLLQQLRNQIREQGPILVSFFGRSGEPKQHKLGVFVANVIRRALRREPAEIGDWLAPYYHHYFTRDDIARELSEGGFRIIHYNAAGYGHAVGIAV